METKGITIEFYGKTVELENSINDINKGLKMTKSEVSDLNKNLKLDPHNFDLLERKLKGLRQEQSLLTEKVKYFEDEVSKLGKEDVGTDKWVSLQKALNNAQTDLRKVTDQIAKQEKINQANTDSIEESAEATKKMGEGFKEAGKGAITFGDIVKANVISSAIINGVKALASELKSLASDLHQWADSYRELEVYEKQFESNIRNTADATDEQIDALKKLAKQKQKEGVISSRALTSAYQELATYVESTDAIEGLTNAMADMAAQQYGVDASADSVRNLATTLGKALANGDYSGLTKLGYGFTDAQQRIMKYGTELERVKVLSDVIGSSIGGMNEALAQTDAGKIFQMKSYFEEVKTSLGGLVSELEVGFMDQILPQIQPIIDQTIGWILDHKDELVGMVSDIVGFISSPEMQNLYSNVSGIATDIGNILGDIVGIMDDMGVIQGLFDAFQWAVQKVKDLFDSIASTVADIRQNGFGSWFMGGAFTTYNPFASSSGGYQSGGFMSGGTINVNNTFNIANGNDVSQTMLNSWADRMTDRINENLGRMYA